MDTYYEDVLHEVLLTLLERQSYSYVIKAIEDENTGECHFYNLALSELKRAAIDKYRVRRVLFDIDSQYEEVLYDESAPILANMSEFEFAKFRDATSHLRSDDFISPLRCFQYYPIKKGWVGGWLHAYKIKGKTYAYWQYSAFIGSRCKGELPKRLKTSKSRHEAYMALVEYNKQLNPASHENTFSKGVRRGR